MTHLYELTEQSRELAQLAEVSDEEMAQAIADTWEALEGEFNDKAVAIVHVTRIIDADVSIIDAEIKRLQLRKKTTVNKIEALKSYLRTNMAASGISKIDCPLFSITLGKPSKIVVIDNESKIPADYLKMQTLMSPMKKEILAALKEDPDAVPGCSLGESKQSLLIR